MKALKSTDPELKQKMDKLAQDNISFFIVDGDTIHTFKSKEPPKIYQGKSRKYSAETLKAGVKKAREKAKEAGLSKLEINDLSENDKEAFRQFKKDSGIEKSCDAFRKLLEIAKINDNQKFYIV